MSRINALLLSIAFMLGSNHVQAIKLSQITNLSPYIKSFALNSQQLFMKAAKPLLRFAQNHTIASAAVAIGLVLACAPKSRRPIVHAIHMNLNNIVRWLNRRLHRLGLHLRHVDKQNIATIPVAARITPTTTKSQQSDRHIIAQQQTIPLVTLHNEHGNIATEPTAESLFNAIRSGDFPKFCELIIRIKNIETQIFQGKHILHYAAELNRITAVSLLLENYRAPVDVKDTLNEETPLHVAARNGHLAVVKLLIKAHASIDARNKLGQTPLHIAADLGDNDIISVLIAAGANPNAQDILKLAPSSYAAFKRRVESLNLLKGAGARDDYIIIADCIKSCRPTATL